MANMQLINRLTKLLDADLHEQNGVDEDPLQWIRRYINALDVGIGSLRVHLRHQEERTDRALRRHVRKQEELERWVRRDARSERQQELTDEVRRLKLSWQETCQEQESTSSLIKKLEERIQEARRMKDFLVAKNRQGRSSSDFIPVKTLRPSASSAEILIEQELQRLKDKRRGETATDVYGADKR
jgi:phage shock protein A